MRRLVLYLAVFALALGAVGPVSAKPVDGSGGGQRFAAGQYVVQMAEMPVVAYDGSIKGLKATKPAQGQKINPRSAAVVKYVNHLKARHSAALQRAGGGRKLYDYVYTYNGFLARLTAKQASALSRDASVLAVTRNEMVDVDTSSTPAFLGLSDPGGLWSQLGGPTGHKNKLTGAGDGIIIGIVDSGIWPENGSFSDRNAAGQLVYQQIPGWHGKCVPGEQFTASLCNQKLIGAQFFNASWGGSAGLEAARPWEFQSARDYNGHGTHTAGTSGGNYDVATTGPASVFGSVSGIAPRARIAAYKALWSTESGDVASGFTGDLVAAIDQSVADGVDVINYSVSGTSTDFAHPAEVAFLFAANAGIFVASSAGNSGPDASTVAHPSPWITTVAAGTHNRDGKGSVTLGNETTYNGASVATPVGPAPFIDAEDAGLAGADPDAVRLCFAAADNDGDSVLDPDKVAGKIVLCERGVTARTNKSLAVQQAGGVGMVLVNTSASSINADFHYVPSVHLPHTDLAAMEAYANTANPTATINQSTIVYDAPAPFTATFSSRGPLLAGGGDLLKPDVIAPGQDILAAVSPTPPNGGRDFNLYSGTSMSSPHVAGLAALLKDAHPSWTPMMVKSALMTTGYDVLDSGSTADRIFSQGAGHVRPNSATDPGLVYNSGWNEWLAFLCGTTTLVNPASCTALAGAGFSSDVSDMNVASIAIGDLAGIQTVTRKVTNVGSTAATYTATANLPGVNVVVSPSTLALNPGQTKSFTVTFTRTTAPLDAYVGGNLTWTDGTHNVRSPLIVKPVALASPAVQTVTAGADSGSANWTVKVGYNGQLSADAFGAVADTVTANQSVAQDPDADPLTDPFDPSKGAYLVNFALGAGTKYWAGGTMEATTEAGSDLDVYLLYEMADGSAGFSFPSDLVALSADGDSEEIAELVHPTAGNYRLLVHGWGTPDGATTFALHSWAVGGAADGPTLQARAGSGDPATVTTGQSVQITLDWSGLTSTGTQYRGLVDYVDGSSDNLGSTVVIINR